MPSQAAALERLRAVLTSNACLDLYSCDVAAGTSGKTFINDLAALTGAAVYASDNLVGTVPGARSCFGLPQRASGHEQRSVLDPRT